MLSGWIIINLPGSPYPAAALTGPPFLFTIYFLQRETSAHARAHAQC